MIGSRLLRTPWQLLWQRRPAAQQATFLLAIDAITNVIDYGFHIYLARVLLPVEFAAAQTINTILLVVLTVSAVMQPVVARYVAATAVSQDYPPGTGHAIFRYYFQRSTLVGFLGNLRKRHTHVLFMHLLHVGFLHTLVINVKKYWKVENNVGND